MFFLPTKIHFLPTTDFLHSMKMAESEKSVLLVNSIIDFDDIQVSLRLFSLSLNAC